MNLLKSLLLELDSKTQIKEKFIEFIEKAGYKHWESARIVTYLPGAGAANPNVREITLKDYSKGTVVKIYFYKKVIRVLLTTNNKLNKAKGLVAPGGAGASEPVQEKPIKQNYKTATFDKQLMGMLVDFDLVFSHLDSGRVEVFKPGPKYKGSPEVRYISLKKYSKGTVAKVRFISNKIIRVLLSTANKVEKLRGLLSPDNVKGVTKAKSKAKVTTLSKSKESELEMYLREKGSDDFAIEFAKYLEVKDFKSNFVAKGVRLDSTSKSSGAARVSVYGNNVRFFPFNSSGGVDSSGKIDIKVVSKLSMTKAKKILLDMQKKQDDVEINSLLKPVAPPPPMPKFSNKAINTSESIPELIETKIKKQCSIAWLAFMKGRGLVRGVREGIGKDYAFVKHLNKRTPKDSRKEIDEYVEEFRKEHFPNIPSRQYSAYSYCFNSSKLPAQISPASLSYGRNHLVFAVNGTTYFQSNKIDDFYQSAPYQAVSNYASEKQRYDKNPDPEEEKYLAKDKERADFELSKYFKNSKDSLSTLAVNKNEVLFNYTKGYYIIDASFADQVIGIARQ